MVCPVAAKSNSVDDVTAFASKQNFPKATKARGKEGIDAGNQEPSDARDDPLMVDLLDLKNMDIMDVLKLISQKTGENIVASKNVKGRVTVFLRNVEVEEAMRILLDAYGWAYKRSDDGIINVMTAQEFENKYGYAFGQKNKPHVVKLQYVNPNDLLPALNQIKSASGKIIADEQSGTIILIDQPDRIVTMEEIINKLDVKVETEVFDLSYAKAEDISNKVQATLTPGIGKMKFDERSNKVIVTDTGAKIAEIQNIVNEFDQKDQAVFIEAKILQIILNDDHKLGVDWDLILTDFNDMNLTSQFDILGSTTKGGTMSVGTIASDKYNLFVEMLDVVGTTEILSNPRITTVNNKEAKIMVGSTEPYVTTTTTTPASGATTIAESVNFIDVGVKLYVTPTIHKDDFITMKIQPEVSTVTSNLTTSNNNTIPIVETSEAETTVLVKDGVTLVIGGLIKEENIREEKRVPFLGDIPVLGTAFKSDSKEKVKTEIVIFLTPKIVTGDEDQSDEIPPIGI
jgi:type II secretory pathway component GspD/PulD (secretin)